MVHEMCIKRIPSGESAGFTVVFAIGYIYTQWITRGMLLHSRELPLYSKPKESNITGPGNSTVEASI